MSDVYFVYIFLCKNYEDTMLFSFHELEEETSIVPKYLIRFWKREDKTNR